jgi:3'-phosphoadenosine 5'-phosphosulfate sulfotransferase
LKLTALSLSQVKVNKTKRRNVSVNKNSIQVKNARFRIKTLFSMNCANIHAGIGTVKNYMKEYEKQEN